MHPVPLHTLLMDHMQSAPESESPPKHKCLPAIEHAESPGQQEASEKDEVLAHAEQGLAELRSLLQEEAQASVELLTALEELKDEVWPLGGCETHHARCADPESVSTQDLYGRLPA